MRLTTLALLAGSLAFTQTTGFAQTPGKVQFEVASVRPVEANNQQVAMGLHLDGKQARISSFSLRDLIGMAYQVRANQINGPDWLPTQRFEVNGTLPEGATTKQLPEMLQTLLAERFGLKYHKEQKEFQVYSLERGSKPLTLKPSETAAVRSDSVTIGGTGSSQGVSVDLGGGASYTFAGGKFEGKKLDMDSVVDTLSLYMNLPVVNRTGIDGFFDVTFELAQEDYRAMLARAGAANGIQLPPQIMQMIETATTPSLFDAIDRLGLKLESKKLPLDVIVIEQVAKAPTDN